MPRKLDHFAAIVVGVAVSALAGCDNKQSKSENQGNEIVVVRAKSAGDTKQGLGRYHGISGSTAGAKAISMHKIIIPPGGAAKPHIHKGYETAVYVLKGRVQTFYGPGLKKSLINEAGDFLYIPPDVPHKPVNLSQTETAEAIVTRTDPNEQESVIPYTP